MPFTTGIVRQLHRQMHSYVSTDGGKWKPTDNDIVEKDAQGNVTRIRFKPVSAVETPQAMEDLARLYEGAIQRQQWEPLIIVPLTILDFLCIHPFTDGNGRISRLLTLMLLYHFDYKVGRYVSLERIVEESRQTYYEALEKSSQGWHESAHDAMPWLNYFWGVLIRAYGEFEERVGVIGGGRGSKTQRVRDAVGRRVAPFRISDIETDCPGVGRDLIRKVLRKMRDEGVVRAEGHGRAARWRRVG
jgi:Fic family protein